MLVKMRKLSLNRIYGQMIVFQSLMNVTSRNRSPFHANGCVFLAKDALALISCLIYC